MKRLFLYLLLFSSCFLHGQSAAFASFKKIIHEHQPELNLENKLIAFNVWSNSDSESRKANMSFEKAFNVYRVAKLKGGLDGIVVATINLENLNADSKMYLKQDGIMRCINLTTKEVAELNLVKNKNLVFDSSGRIIYTDLAAEEIYPAINKLITR